MRGYAFNSTADFDTVRQIKEKLCYVGYDIDIEKKLSLETTSLVEQYKVGTCNETDSIYYLSMIKRSGRFFLSFSWMLLQSYTLRLSLIGENLSTMLISLYSCLMAE